MKQRRGDAVVIEGREMRYCISARFDQGLPQPVAFHTETQRQYQGRQRRNRRGCRMWQRPSCRLTHLYPIMGRDGSDRPRIRRFWLITD